MQVIGEEQRREKEEIVCRLTTDYNDDLPKKQLSRDSEQTEMRGSITNNY
jgi:hypothetical protein